MECDPSERLREQIGVYRKAAGITMEELGRRINKNKTTVWKYEKGLIRIDLRTLYDIAGALGVSVSHLVDAASVPNAERAERAAAERPAHTYYMYYYDGYRKKLSRSFIRVGAQGNEASMFYHLNAFDRPEGCRDFYTGRVSVAEPYMNFVFRNVNNRFETLFIVAKEPFKNVGVMKGLLTGISYKVFQPISFKVVMAEYELTEDAALAEWLSVRKTDAAHFRKYNAFVLSEEYDRFKPRAHPSASRGGASNDSHAGP